MIDQKELMRYLKKINPMAEGVFIDPKELVFEENVMMNCFYCGKYGNNWRCPPNLPNVNFPKMMAEFEAGLFVFLTYYPKNEEDYKNLRGEAALTLHKNLLMLEKWMYNHNSSTAVSFIGGSCRLCKNGCGKERCNNPYLSRSPLESTGVNIIKSAKKYGIDIKFPADQKLMRLGLLLFQEEL
ncbi:MAG: DUF2284 domain-containing protein [Oscillospiraceae bacterium]|nr:DUF2284 domain-containing protein [Oscillospiraceae bacterium]